MTKLEAMKALAKKVEVGEDLSGNVDFWVALNIAFERRGALASEAAKAYHGSLDAAKALHEAVLPGWGWTFPHSEKCTLVHSDFLEQHGHHHNNPARAWLLAILKALIAQEEAA